MVVVGRSVAGSSEQRAASSGGRKGKDVTELPSDASPRHRHHARRYCRVVVGGAERRVQSGKRVQGTRAHDRSALPCPAIAFIRLHPPSSAFVRLRHCASFLSLSSSLLSQTLGPSFPLPHPSCASSHVRRHPSSIDESTTTDPATGNRQPAFAFGGFAPSPSPSPLGLHPLQWVRLPTQPTNQSIGIRSINRRPRMSCTTRTPWDMDTSHRIMAHVQQYSTVSLALALFLLLLLLFSFCYTTITHPPHPPHLRSFPLSALQNPRHPRRIISVPRGLPLSRLVPISRSVER